MTLTIKTDRKLRSTPGNFNALVDLQNKKLLLPPEVTDAVSFTLREGQSADAFIGVTMWASGSLAIKLNWTEDQVETAAVHLAKNLADTGLISADLLAPPQKRGYGFGGAPAP